MKCPACAERRQLRSTRTEEGLRVRTCPSCQGRWVRSDDYWRWRSQTETDARPADAPVDADPVAEPRRLRFCPEDAYILAGYRVGPPHGFLVDQCRNCSGIWLDGGEWESLVEGGLATRLQDVLSEDWQDRIREGEQHHAERSQWERQLAPDDLDRIAGIKAWLDGHPQRSELYAYLRFHERAV